MITIIDYGVGNLRSVEKAFNSVGVDVRVSAQLAEIENATALVLPGVGAFGDAIDCLRARGFDQAIKKAAEQGKQILGVCLGYQLLFEESEEFGRHRGLGLLPGKVVRFADNELRVPHIGWNQVQRHRPHPLFNDIEDNAYFYFVHSYFVQAGEADLIGVTQYGLDFAASAARDNIAGVQFHPEKSQHAGLKLLKNFAQQVEKVC